MDIQAEIDLKKDLKQVAVEAMELQAEAAKLAKQAEEHITDAVEESYKKGANVSFIANALNTNRQRIYMLLASRGIRPGKDIVNV
jgi:hypothetical protein